MDLFDNSINPLSICVDASCRGNPGPMEYRGVDTQSREVIFDRRYALGTNNLGEFLGIIHALGLITRDKLHSKYSVIYSDSLVAITWFSQVYCKSGLKHTDDTEQLLEDIGRSMDWLRKNQATITTKVCKWDTHQWGEIPADYQRKR